MVNNTEYYRENLSQVPSDDKVLRLARVPKDYKEKRNILAIQLSEDFKLSSKDKISIPAHLSVWVKSYISPEQAYKFLLKNNPNSDRKLVVYLPVDEIRKIIGYATEEKIYPNLLDVLFIELVINNSEKDENNPKSIFGHAGITGLDIDNDKEKASDLSNREAKNLRKDLRSKLAEIASKEHSLLKE
jgi:hypothetical protein